MLISTVTAWFWWEIQFPGGTAGRFPALDLNCKPGNCFVSFALINCQHIKSFPKHFRLYTTATNLGLPEPFLLQVSLHWKRFFQTIKAVKTGIKQLNFINMPKYSCINVCNTFFGIWQHINALTLHKITVLVQWT